MLVLFIVAMKSFNKISKSVDFFSANHLLKFSSLLTFNQQRVYNKERSVDFRFYFHVFFVHILQEIKENSSLFFSRIQLKYLIFEEISQKRLVSRQSNFSHLNKREQGFYIVSVFSTVIEQYLDY